MPLFAVPSPALRVLPHEPIVRETGCTRRCPGGQAALDCTPLKTNPRVYSMRTSKVLDDGLAGETMRCTDVKTKQELVDPGLWRVRRGAAGFPETARHRFALRKLADF